MTKSEDDEKEFTASEALTNWYVWQKDLSSDGLSAYINGI